MSVRELYVGAAAAARALGVPLVEVSRAVRCGLLARGYDAHGVTAVGLESAAVWAARREVDAFETETGHPLLPGHRGDLEREARGRWRRVLLAAG